MQLSVVTCMESICEEGLRKWSTDSLRDASGLLLAITASDFISALVVTNKCLWYLRALTCSLTAEAKDVVQALGLAPEYIAHLLHEYVPTRALWSAGANLLLEPQTNTRWGARVFSKAAPVLWNTLPSTIKTAPSLASFKLGLKTYLFKAAFL